MPQTVVALYSDLADAHRVVNALTNAGFDSEQISLAAPDPDGEYAAALKESAEEEESPREEAVDGALIGGTVGGLAGLLFGLAAFSIPGLGPLLVAGPLYTTVMGAGIGGVSGGLLGALVEAGVPEEEAVFYKEGVRRGYTLVAVETDHQGEADEAARILQRNDPVDIGRRAQSWQEAGWEAPEDVPDQFIPSVDDESDQNRYATGAMGEDMYGERATRSRPPLPTEEDDAEA